MKKMMITFWAVLFISGCGFSSGMEGGSNGVYVHIKNNTDFNLYGLELNMETSSHMVINANGTEVEKGESMVIELLKGDMSASSSEQFELFIITNENGDKRLPVEHSYTIDFNPGQSWYFELKGNDVKDLALYKER
ncbi:hypothetical protein [Jeotgalibacillus salarius]|uniref:Lipoprotein n=1 Tax=Jeotgalibacillus salarius TaxID=546023 RepID=A0A4Y8LHP7_9BACL|nr:hypothetical protein [Jeotgalibacillus salarius]TFE02332.1 hypothetical protein E2626_07070 [Jeotgalibacillus salarius]